MKTQHGPHLISVIIPVHNSGKYLKQCLESVTTQLYSKIEIIIVNDDSEDDSEDIINTYLKRDSRIKYYLTKQNNAALTRNEGLKHALGDYICFVDSDDIIRNNYVGLLYNTIINNEVEVASGKIALFYNDKQIDRKYSDSNLVHIEKDTLLYFCKNFNVTKEGSFVAQSINAKIFSRNSLENIDYSVIKSSVLEDNYIIPQILKRIIPQKIALVDSTVYFYRQHANSTMAGSLKTKIKYGKESLTYPELFEKNIKYIKNLYVNDDKSESYLSQLRNQFYFELAQSLINHTYHLSKHNNQLIEHNKYLTERNKYLDDKNKKLDKDIKNKQHVIDELLSSRAYRFVVYVLSQLKAIDNKIKQKR